MDFKNIRRCVAGIVLALAAVGLGLSPVDAAEKESKALSTRVTAIDFDECEPFQIRAKIMELHPENGTIVVAEREIRALDVGCRGKIDQNRIPHDGWQTGIAERFSVGQYVLVKGVLHPDGFVAAFVVQKIVNRRMKDMSTSRTWEVRRKPERLTRRPAAPAASSN